MKEKILAWLKTPAAWISGIVAIVLLYIKYLRNKNTSLEADAELAETKKKDAILVQQQADNKAHWEEAVRQLEEDKGRKLTDEEMNEWLKKL